MIYIYHTCTNTGRDPLLHLKLLENNYANLEPENKRFNSNHRLKKQLKKTD